ncbi:MAG: hypothetical protein JJU05_09865 [Verrucomicrobia bacterium]|nr:hypothetical protein [Verrucomicrobiota bacterium]MCH8527545.1 hypothetical protein [Kiritimatiellia bacterium]
MKKYLLNHSTRSEISRTTFGTFPMKRIPFLQFNLLAVFFGVLTLNPAHAQDRNQEMNIVYPPGAFHQNGGPVIDITNTTLFSPNAVGDGVTDDTGAFIAMLNYLRNRIEQIRGTSYGGDHKLTVYIPSGTYLVSDTLVHEGSLYRGFCYLRIVGQNRENTVIRLQDNSPGFGPGARKAVLPFTKVGQNQGNIMWGNQLRNITIDTGSGNPGAVGVVFLGANACSLDNVTIRSGDGQGSVGLDFITWSVQGHFSDITIEGFDYAVRTDDSRETNPTLEYITISGQNNAGIHGGRAALSIRKLHSTNQVPAVIMDRRGGHVVVLDSVLNGGSPAFGAIEMGDPADHQLFVRNVVSSGYAATIRQMIPSSQNVVVDNADATGVEITGSWVSGTWSGGGAFIGQDYLHDNDSGKGSKSVRFRPNLQAGIYQVEMNYSAAANRAGNVPVDIEHQMGTDYLTISQQSGGGQWQALGRYNFAAGTGGSVRIGNEGTNGFVIADAIRFVRMTVNDVTGPVSEWLSGQVYRIDSSTPAQSLNLPVEEVSLVPWESNPANWASPEDFTGTAEQRIQAALDSGKPAIYFPKTYTITNLNRVFTIPASVRQIDFMHQSSLFTSRFDVAEPSSQPLWIEHAGAKMPLWISAARTVHLRFSSIALRVNTPENVTIHAQNMGVLAGGDSPHFCPPNARIYGRSINEETTWGTNYVIDGGLIWVMGFKTERPRSAFEVYNGGFLEVLGGYQNFAGAGDEGRPVVLNDHSNVSYIGTNYMQNGYQQGIWEVRDGTTHKFLNPGFPRRVIGTGTGNYFVPLYVGYDPAAPLPGSGHKLSTTALVVDNSDATGFSSTGTWTTTTFSPGYVGPNYIHDGNTGKGTKTATYTPVLQDGLHAVYANYTADMNRASRIPVEITHAAGVDLVHMNQTMGGGGWVLLGVFPFSSGTSGNARIFTANTNGFVVADAFRFVKLDEDQAAEVIVDNADATGVQITGQWVSTTFTPGYHGPDYLHDNNTDKGQKSVHFTPDLAASGTYDVYIQYPDGINRASNVPIDITHATGTDLISLDQRTGGGQWVLLGTYNFNSGTAGNILISNSGTNGFVMADAVRFVPAQSHSPADLIVDNTDNTGVEINGSWTISTWAGGGGFIGADYLHDGNADKGSKTVRYRPSIPASGTYEVFIHYTSSSNRASNVPIDITHAGGTDYISLDQRSGGGQWVLLGTYTFNAGTGGSVLVSNTGTNGFVIADAVRFTSVP